MKYRITEIEFDFTDDIGDGDTMDDFLTAVNERIQ